MARRKRKSIPKFESIKNKYWPIIRKFVIERDKRCQICGSYQSLQVDHFISRKNRSVFFDIRNLTTLCARCHLLKTWGHNGHPQEVHKIVESREGKEVINELIIRSKKPRKYECWELDAYIEELKIMGEEWKKQEKQSMNYLKERRLNTQTVGTTKKRKKKDGLN